MISEGITITLVGMGTVFSFLVLLVLAMLIMAKVVIWLNKVMPEQVAEVKAKPVRVENNDDVAVAIAVAKMNMQ